MNYVIHICTKEAQTSKDTRIPCPHEDHIRSQRSRSSPLKRTQARCCIVTNHMISRSQRISAEQLDQLMEKGRVFHSPLFVMRILTIDSSIRCAAIVPKKIAPSAVLRNSMRRKIYSAARPHVQHITTPVCIALFAKQRIGEIPVQMLAEGIKGLFVKAGILR